MENELLAIGIGLILSVLSLYAFLVYLRTLLQQDKEKINFGTWFILAYGDGLDLTSYFFMTEKWWLNLVPLSFALGSITIFVVALLRGSFGTLRRIDVFCIVTDIAITVGWYYLSRTEMVSLSLSYGEWSRTFELSTVANLAYQMSAIIAFIPMWWSQLEGREQEPPVPWLLWAVVFGGFTILIGFAHDKWEELVYPSLNLFTHYMIGATALSLIRHPR